MRKIYEPPIYDSNPLTLDGLPRISLWWGSPSSANNGETLFTNEAFDVQILFVPQTSVLTKLDIIRVVSECALIFCFSDDWCTWSIWDTGGPGAASSPSAISAQQPSEVTLEGAHDVYFRGHRSLKLIYCRQ